MILKSTVSKTIVISSLLLLLFVDNVLMAQDFAIQGTFENVGNNKLPKNWEQDFSEKFQPAGKAEVIDETLSKPIKAIKITSGTKATLIHTVKSYPVQNGDCIAVQLHCKGKGVANAGYLGFDSSMRQIACVAQSFTAYHDRWEYGSKVFEIKDPKITSMKIFFSAPPDTAMSFADISVKKLTNEEATLYSSSKSRELWKKRTQGENLSIGKKLRFIPKPNYELTIKGDTDETDLTNGRLGDTGMLWFNAEAVAWFNAHSGVSIIIDLGTVQSVKKTVIRINGGRLSGITFPKELETWVSKDGENYYQTASLTKVAQAENYLSDWKSLYYLPESEDNSGLPYVYPFELEVNADTRYIVIRAPIYTPFAMVSDELAVIKAEEVDCKNQNYNIAYKKQPQVINHQTVIIRPRMNKFYVPLDIQVPNWLLIDDRRPEKKGKLGYIIDVPDTVDFIVDQSYPNFTRTLGKTETQLGRKRYYFSPSDNFIDYVGGNIGPFFFSTHNDKTPDKEKYVLFTSTLNGEPQYTHRTPLEIINIPQVPELKKLITSAWIRNDQSFNWPDFLKAQHHLGFNTILFFPLLGSSDKYKSVVNDAAKKGFKICLLMEPSLNIKSWAPNIEDYKCIGHKSKKSVCPSYRGEYHQKMLSGITNAVKNYPADYITFDEESWLPNQLKDCINCSCCDELRKSKGMEWNEYLEWIQADYLKGFKEAVAKGIGDNKMPLIGYYGLEPNFYYGQISFLGFKYLFPKYCDQLQPSYYGDDSRKAHDMIRKVFNKIPNPEIIIPWLTSGSGAFSRGTPREQKTEQQLLEILMNGAGGVIYYVYCSFESPLDYYYVAAALKKIAPYESLLMEGKLLDITGSDKSLVYTVRKHNNDMLLLVGNYGKLSDSETTIELPQGSINKIIDLNQNTDIPFSGNRLNIKIKPDDFTFYYIQYK